MNQRHHCGGEWEPLANDPEGFTGKCNNCHQFRTDAMHFVAPYRIEVKHLHRDEWFVWYTCESPRRRAARAVLRAQGFTEAYIDSREWRVVSNHPVALLTVTPEGRVI